MILAAQKAMQLREDEVVCLLYDLANYHCQASMWELVNRARSLCGIPQIRMVTTGPDPRD